MDVRCYQERERGRERGRGKASKVKTMKTEEASNCIQALKIPFPTSLFGIP
jgi:hypothetical protein